MYLAFVSLYTSLCTLIQTQTQTHTNMTLPIAVCYWQVDGFSVSRYRLIQKLIRLLPSHFHKYSDNSAQLDKAVYRVQYIIFSVSWFDILRGIAPLPLASLITLRHTTFGKNPQHEWSASSRDLCVKTHNNHKRRASTPPPQAGFKPAIPASDRPYSHTGHWDWQPM